MEAEAPAVEVIELRNEPSPPPEEVEAASDESVNVTVVTPPASESETRAEQAVEMERAALAIDTAERALARADEAHSRIDALIAELAAIEDEEIDTEPTHPAPEPEPHEPERDTPPQRSHFLHRYVFGHREE